MTLLLLDGQLAETGTVLPALLADADALAALAPAPLGNGALTLRSQIRQVAGSLMLHVWQFAAAERAFDLLAGGRIRPAHRGVGDGRTLLGTDPAGPSRRDDGAGIPVG